MLLSVLLKRFYLPIGNSYVILLDNVINFTNFNKQIRLLQHRSKERHHIIPFPRPSPCVTFSSSPRAAAPAQQARQSEHIPLDIIYEIFYCYMKELYKIAFSISFYLGIFSE